MPRHAGGTTARLAATATVKPRNLGNALPPRTPLPVKAWGTMFEDLKRLESRTKSAMENKMLNGSKDTHRQHLFCTSEQIAPSLQTCPPKLGWHFGACLESKHHGISEALAGNALGFYPGA